MKEPIYNFRNFIAFFFLNYAALLVVLFSISFDPIILVMFLLFIISTVYFTISLSTKYNFFGTLGNTLLLNFITAFPIHFVFMLYSFVNNSLYEYLLFIILFFLSSMLLSLFICFLRNIKLPNVIQDHIKFLNFRNLLFLEILFILCLFYYFDFFELIFIQKIPLTVYSSYLSLKNEYNCGSGCHVSIWMCTNIDKQKYLKLSGGYFGDTFHLATFYDQSGKLICDEFWDVREAIGNSTNTKKCLINETCIQITD